MTSLRFPVDGAFRIGYGFGPRGDIGVPGASTNHEGIDIVRPDGPLPVGTPIHAILPGRVLSAGNSGGGAGYTVLTEHRNWFGATYRVRSNHFSRWLVHAGQRIEQGDVLGLSGGVPGTPGAGSSGGAHYHCGLYKVVNGHAVAIDPGPFFGLGSTRGIGTTRKAVTFPAFAGLDSKPFEEDDMTPHESSQLNAIFNAIFNGGDSMPDGGRSVGASLADIAQKVGHIVRDGKPISLRQEVADAKTTALKLTAQVAALTNLVEQLTAGTAQIDMGAVEAAAEAGARDALARLTISIED